MTGERVRGISFEESVHGNLSTVNGCGSGSENENEHAWEALCAGVGICGCNSSLQPSGNVAVGSNMISQIGKVSNICTHSDNDKDYHDGHAHENSPLEPQFTVL